MSIRTSKAHLLEYLWKAAIETEQEIQSKFVQDFKWIYTDIFLQYSLPISHVAVIPALHATELPFPLQGWGWEIY